MVLMSSSTVRLHLWYIYIFFISLQGHQSYSSQQQVIKIQRDFSLSSHLSEKDERSCWMQESVFPDKISLERCLAARSACISGDAQWPCIFDPHQQYEKYLLALYVKTSSANAGSKESKCMCFVVYALLFVIGWWALSHIKFLCPFGVTWVLREWCEAHPQWLI